MIIAEDVYLAHYGVKGMKWGVRNEDRPVSAKRQARREAKAAGYDAHAARLRTRLSTLEKNKERYHPAYYETNKKDLEKELKDTEDAAQAKREGRLTAKQKRNLMIAGGLLAAYGTYKIANTGEVNRQILKGKAFVHGKDSVFNKNEKLARKDMDVDEIMSDVVKHINPGYGGIGTKQNCRRATFAYEMRRRGFDVAATRTTNAYGQTAAGLINATSPGEKFLPTSKVGMISKALKEQVEKKRIGASTPFTDAITGAVVGKERIRATNQTIDNAIFTKLRSMPDGARGELGVTWTPGGGHSVAWEIVKGKPVIFDTQSGKRFTSAAEMTKEYGNIIKDAGVTRLDNIPLNDEFLMRWMKNAK